ncbi:hypothetical protein [Eilatimonas milleporae]|uniref:Uncharacterized protein n=1 Tax=Eilatimonas milleporae TaxID=911205 RepID=A0A3M0CIB0_9PROT|nr:hypothetical protein [Eilatimonas milleporae]RMB08497.1 hypothetical protein BXY39_1130 [Eilatimonas milleporae]
MKNTGIELSSDEIDLVSGGIPLIIAAAIYGEAFAYGAIIGFIALDRAINS